ncbi:hypothetical protein GCM10009127_06130 [Alteraurantiacibacter aestuarii]|uniref:Uncharacterized protein n=1 Tax=Alteraurantiacibacter aestuarii TaxID=650004 RepID=A0A844ZKY1_9SPHN|nr:hypothetical protein [Alteraurantiacibacter aestuarii]MXO89091.1 hypothetical protein [Alteraurantiacibacter aestuarii]
MKSLRLAAMAIAASLAATFTGVPAMAQDSSALGTWDTAIDVQGTKIESTLILTQADDGYGVEIVDGPMPGAPADAPPMASVISDVAVDGATFTFKRALTTPQGPMNLTYSGTADGDTLTGQILSDFGPIPLTGTRAEAAE